MSRFSFPRFTLTGHESMEQWRRKWRRRFIELHPRLAMAEAADRDWLQRHGWCPDCHGWVEVEFRSGKRLCPFCGEEVMDEHEEG